MPSRRQTRRQRRNNSARSAASATSTGSKLMHGMKFREVPIIDIDVIGDSRNILTTENFIDKISEYSTMDRVVDCGGFLVMRPRKDQYHRYLIDPQKIPQFDAKSHSVKHYHFHHQRGTHRHSVQYNKEWVHDIPQLSAMVDGKPLMVGSYPQRTSDVLPPLLTPSQPSTSPGDRNGNGKRHPSMPELFRQQTLSRKIEAFQAKAQMRQSLDRMDGTSSSSSNTSDDASQVLEAVDSDVTHVSDVEYYSRCGVTRIRRRKRKRHSTEEQRDGKVIESSVKRRKLNDLNVVKAQQFVLPKQVKVPLQSTSFELPLEVLHCNIYQDAEDVVIRKVNKVMNHHDDMDMDTDHMKQGMTSHLKNGAMNHKLNGMMKENECCMSTQDEWCKSREEEQFKLIPEQALCALTHSEKRHDEISCGSEQSDSISRSSHSFPTSLGSTASTTSSQHYHDHPPINTMMTSNHSNTMSNAQLSHFSTNTHSSSCDPPNTLHINQHLNNSNCSKSRRKRNKFPLIDRNDLLSKSQHEEEPFIARPPVTVQEEKDGDVIMLSTNISNQFQDETYHDTVALLDSILTTSRCSSPPITIIDVAMAQSMNLGDHKASDRNHNKSTVNPPILQLPSLDESEFASTSNIKHEAESIPNRNGHKSLNDLNHLNPSTESLETVHDISSLTASHTNLDDVPLDHFRGFALMVNQSGQGDVPVADFWDRDHFEATLNDSPYDNVSAEVIPLIFAKQQIRGESVPYGIIENNVTLYEEKSPLDLINLSLHGPFAEFKEGGDGNEYMEGVHQPYIYLGNVHTWFAWHREDMNLYAVNHLLWGSDKIWYCIPPRETRKVMEFVRRQYATYCGNVDDCFTPLQHKQFWFDPYSLLCEGIEVLFFRQKPGDIMITPPGGLHCGLNTGPNMAESLNFMTYDVNSWSRCLSAFYFGLFNNPKCDLCRRSVLFDVHQLAERCRNSESAKQRKNAPKLSVIPRMQSTSKGKVHRKRRCSNSKDILDLTVDEEEETMPPICNRSVIEKRLELGVYDHVKAMKGERLWVYPVRSGKKYYYPAVWLTACMSVDDLQFEIRYQFKYLDSGTAKGRNYPEYVSEHDVLWEKGLLMRDWNRTQKFKLEKGSLFKMQYPRRQGTMLLNYCGINRGEYKQMYCLKKLYYRHYPKEIQYRDSFKSRHQKFRTQKEMMRDIDEQHRYFTQPLVSTSEEDTETETSRDEAKSSDF